MPRHSRLWSTFGSRLYVTEKSEQEAKAGNEGITQANRKKQANSGERTSSSCFERFAPFATAFKDLPHRSSLNRFLADVDRSSACALPCGRSHLARRGRGSGPQRLDEPLDVSGQMLLWGP